MKDKLLLKVLLICTMLFAGFNYLPQFKLGGVPIFQILIVASIVIASIFYKIKPLPNIFAIKSYCLYLLCAIPALLFGMFLGADLSLLVYLYTLFPLLLFWFTFDKLNKEYYHFLLMILSVSMVLVTIVGWLLRLSILPINTFFDVLDSEFLIGYWGIGYRDSTRNHDYLYPLVGLAISSYFFTIKRFKSLNLVLIILFITTLIASLSRAAIIISVVALFLLLKSTTRQTRIGIFVVLILIVSFNFGFLQNEYETKFDLIINSIFSTKNISGQFSNEERLKIVNDALSASLINPLGYGINNYSSIYPMNYVGHVSKSGENAYLTILVERGWFAFICFILLFVSIIRKNLKKVPVNLNAFLIPFLAIYFLFNYELSNVFAAFIFYIVFLSAFFNKQDIHDIKSI